MVWGLGCTGWRVIPTESTGSKVRKGQFVNLKPLPLASGPLFTLGVNEMGAISGSINLKLVDEN